MADILAALPPLPPITIEDVAAMQQHEENAFMFGWCPCGAVRSGGTRTGVFGETVTEIYCPTCGRGGDV